jgi:hypothetical protein
MCSILAKGREIQEDLHTVFWLREKEFRRIDVQYSG